MVGSNWPFIGIANPMVTLQITSRDPKKSRSWPRYLWSLISQPCEIHGRFILTTNRKPHLGNPVVTWPMTSRDPKGQGRDPITLKLNISITVRDRRLVLIDHLWETPYCESNGHVTDDITWPQNVNVVTQITLNLNISKTVRNGWIATKLAHNGPHMGLHPRYAQGQGQG